MSELRRAIAEGQAFGMPESAVRAYLGHKSSAARRAVPFEFSLSEWWSWWSTDNRWERRGLMNNGLVMGRKGDVGPYHPDNVYCVTNGENVSHTTGAYRRKNLRKAADGRTHYMGAIKTPLGVFNSIRTAAKAHGFDANLILTWVNGAKEGWEFVDMPDEPTLSIMVTLASMFRDMRIQKGLTQSELAEHADVAQETISRLELGTGNPTMDVLVKLATALDQEFSITLARD